MTADASVERLVAHREFVRRLARRLVRDPHDADDLEQDVWLTALRRPPRRGDGLAGWFRRVARSRAVDAARAEARRAQLHRPADEATAPSAAELGVQLDAERRVAAAVARLDEPYRTVILLRYYDDVASSEIASRTGVPLDTVRTRLRRAIGRLREDLDRGAGGRDAWTSTVLPLAGDAARRAVSCKAGASTGGGIVMGVKATIAAAAAGAVIASLVTVRIARPTPVADAPETASAADVRGLARRLDVVEARAPQSTPSRTDVRVRAQEDRIAALEATVADLQARAGSAPTKPAVPDRRADGPAPDESVDGLRRIVTDAARPESKRLEAFARLRMIPSGFTLDVVVAARDVFRSTAAPESRDAILRDLHNVRDPALLPEVRALFVTGLRDPDERVRERAARDADTFASDPAVRQALETARDGDPSDAVRVRAAKSLR